MPRNSSGTYSLPSGNPVVTNTLIQSTWANSTLSDVGTAMTDSLDRNGRGAMLAPLKNIDGTAVAPSITFSSEGTLGVYRVSAGVLGIAAGGALVLSIAAAGLTFTSPLVLPIGSAAAPSLTFVSNTNTGIYSPTTNQVAISTSGVQRVLVDGTGALTVASGVLSLAAAGNNIVTASNAAGLLLFQTAGGSTRMTIDTTGHVLIGTTTATNNVRVGQLLGVVAIGAVGGASLTTYNATGTATTLDLQHSNGATDQSYTTIGAANFGLGSIVFRGSNGTGFGDGAVITGNSDAAWTGSSQPTYLIFGTTASGATATTERARIDSAGNLGIGGTALARLHVIAGDAYVYNGTNGANQGGALGFGIGTLAASAPMSLIKGALVNVAGSEQQGGIAFQTRPNGVAGQALTERLRIGDNGQSFFTGPSTGNGLVNISGTLAVTDATGSYLTQLTSTANLSTLSGFSASGQALAFSTAPNGGAATERVRIDLAGNVGIGTSGPAAKLDVRGNILALSVTAAAPLVTVQKADSGTPNQAGGALQLINLHANNTGRNADVVAGKIQWQFSQPTSGGAQDAASITVAADGAQSGANTQSYMAFGTTAVAGTTPTERMRIDSAGNVGISITPVAKLSIASASSTASTTTVWNNAFTVFGPQAGVTTGAAFAIGYNNSSDQSELLSLAPGTAWKPMRFFGSAFRFIETGSTTILDISSTGVISDGAANELGWKDIPQNAQTGAYVLVLADRGKSITITTGGVTIPSGIFSAGNVVTITNNSGSSQTITQGASTTVHQAGTTNTGNRTLLPWGIATMECIASNVFILSGSIT